MAVTLVFLVLVALIALYLYLTKNLSYWQKRGIPCADGALPGIGPFWNAVTFKTTIADCCRKIYDANKDHSMVGFYNFMTPTLLIREPELVKTVLQTSFTSFHDNGFRFDPKLETILVNCPAIFYGEEWVTKRKYFTSAFASMRLKILLESIKQVCTKFEGYLDRKLSKTREVELELKDLFARFTAQVVSSAGFGVDGMCFDEEKEKVSFHTMGKSFIESNIRNKIVLTILFFMPFFGKIFKTRILSKKAADFFRTTIADVMEHRERETTSRNDFLQLMVDLERTESDKFDVDSLASRLVIFFLDGYETSSAVLSYIGFNLARHPKVQERLREEVVSVLNKYNGVITYDALKEMTYMDQVMSETQRLVVVIGFLYKICTEAIELKGSDGLVCHVERGTHIMIPSSALQTDPRYWENPEVFDPDRFGPDRKQSIERFAFLPFGEGPRMCAGRRMAQLQIKACLATFLRKYSLELSPKTRLPLKLIPSTFANYAEGGLWAIIRPI